MAPSAGKRKRIGQPISTTVWNSCGERVTPHVLRRSSILSSKIFRTASRGRDYPPAAFSNTLRTGFAGV